MSHYKEYRPVGEPCGGNCPLKLRDRERGNLRSGVIFFLFAFLAPEGKK